MTQLTVSAARRKFGSNYNIAQVCGVHRATPGRWGRFVPDDYIQKLLDTPAFKLKKGGKR